MTKEGRLCARRGNWRFFCDEHKTQFFKLFFRAVQTSIFYYVAGAASIVGLLLTFVHKDKKQETQIRPMPSFEQSVTSSSGATNSPNQIRIVVLEFDAPGPIDYPIGAVIATNLSAIKTDYKNIDIKA